MSTDLASFGRIVDTRGIPAPVIVEPYYLPDVTGIRAEWRFANGWGASVIPTRYKGEVELAVLRDNGTDRWDLDYRTEVTGDVVRIIDPTELIDILTVLMNDPRVVRCCQLMGDCEHTLGIEH